MLFIITVPKPSPVNVHLREKKLVNGRLSLYLHYYIGGVPYKRYLKMAMTNELGQGLTIR